MNKNDTVELSITDLTTDGEGVGRSGGCALFVKGAVPGDVVEASVMKMKKTYGYARLVRVVTPSPDRADPACPLADKCGGCQLQSLSYEAQLRFKQDLVTRNLQRIGGLPAYREGADEEPQDTDAKLEVMAEALAQAEGLEWQGYQKFLDANIRKTSPTA